MAERPVFIPQLNNIGVDAPSLSFTWHAGYSLSQKQKSIKSLHESVKSRGASRILEISSKSEEELGQALSAFNLSAKTKETEKIFTVETAFQSSKIFENGGPYNDLLFGSSRAAKKDNRIRDSGRVIGFEFSKKRFPTWPLTYFYDWLYSQFLLYNDRLSMMIVNYDAFTDIEFNPEKSINCQAHSAALFVSMKACNTPDCDIANPDTFLQIANDYYKSRSILQNSVQKDEIETRRP